MPTFLLLHLINHPKTGELTLGVLRTWALPEVVPFDPLLLVYMW